MPTKWDRMVEKVEFIDVYGIKTIFSEDAANLLARQHARVERMVKKLKRDTPVHGHENDERVIGYVLACNDILAALAKEKGGKK